MTLTDNGRGALYMNIAMAAFTLNDTCMKAVTQTLPLFQTITLRGLLTVVMLVLVGWAMGALRLRLPRQDAVVVGVRSLGEIAGTVFFLTALMHMPLANLSAIMQSLPLAVTLAAALFYREKVGWRRMIAIGIGFVGVLIIIRPGTAGFDFWSLMGLLSVLCVVVRDLATRRLSRDIPSVAVAIYAAGTVTLMGIAGAVFQGWAPVDGHQALLIVGASGSLIIGYLFVVMVMRVGDIGFIAPFRYTALIWAILLGWLSFGQLPDGWTMVGAGIVIATGLFTLYRERKLGQAVAVPPKAGLRIR